MASGAALVGCGSSSATKSPAHAAGSSKSSSASSSSGAATGSYSYGGSSSSGYGSSSGSSTGAATKLTTKHSKYGTILAAGPKQLTVYLFEGDRGSSSHCMGACATAWPPVKATGAPAAGGQAMAAHLGTITRSDGTKQLTYAGHPLYYFVRDKDPSDVYGEGVKAFGAGWYVLAPTGRKIDNS